ncbi:3-dehydroquinate synthase [Roseovarius pacificus]|uniref:3-dehydroquinate synthase n=1 Tax=Roseovarius pacificus TaxID=337701 RepID=UPI002A18CEA2|nr:3-dehydroquinate synthase [Roseovarius pacificus]
MSLHNQDVLRVDLPPRSYNILVGDDVLDRAGSLMKPVLRQSRVFVVTDSGVAPHYLARLEAALDKAGISHDSHVVPAGEATKEFDTLRDLIERMLTARVERLTSVVALGGGVVGDLAGLAASLTLRGLDFVQIPTTLLAQVDSSVGGKTAVNSRFGKNLIGTFHQPRLVLTDVTILDSLPRREFLAGYAETVKHGMIDDAELFDYMDRTGAAFRAGDRNVQRETLIRSCSRKVAIVAADEREEGRRALLNLGHTFGHAFEVLAGYDGRLLHGEAVAIGCVLAFDLSVRLGLCPAEDAERVRRHLADAGLAVNVDRLATPEWNVDRVMDLMLTDKKVRGGRPTFILARGIGKAFVAHDIEPEVVRAMLGDFLPKR